MKKVICVGIAVMDHIFHLKEIPTTLGKHFADNYLEVGGGPAATAAVAIAKLGGNVELWGRVGDDRIGDRIIEELNEYGVDTTYIKQIPSCASSISAVLVDQEGERLIINRPVKNLDPDPSWLPLERIEKADAVLSDAAWPDGGKSVLKAARHYHVPSVLDADKVPHDQLPDLVQEASHIAFSENGLKLASDAKEVKAALQDNQHSHHTWLGVTMGGAGTYWVENDTLLNEPAFKVDVVDTLGAGDVFHGALAFALAEGSPIKEAIRFANATAALKCTKPGGRAGIPSYEEVQQLITKA